MENTAAAKLEPSGDFEPQNEDNKIVHTYDCHGCDKEFTSENEVTKCTL